MQLVWLSCPVMTRLVSMLQLARGLIRRRGLVAATVARRWFAFFVPATLCLAFILSVGPFLQSYIVSLVSSDAPSIYGSAYADGLASFPSLDDWLLAGFDWDYLVVSGLAVSVACYSQTARGQFASLAVACSVGLSAVDVLAWATEPSIDLGQLLVSFCANLTGSAVVALLLLTIIWMHERVAPGGGQTIRAVYLILAGLAVSVLTHYALLFFYKPLSVRVDFTASRPMSGVFNGHRIIGATTRRASQKNVDTARPRAFGLLPEVNGGRGEVNSPAGRLKVSWRPNAPGPGYLVNLTFYANCFGPRQIAKLPSWRVGLVRPGVRSLDLAFDGGQTWFGISPDERNRLSYVDAQPLLFSTQSEKDGIRITYFSTGEGTLRNVGPERQAFFLNAALMKSDGSSGVIVPRALDLIVNGERQRIVFERTGTINADATHTCQALVPPPGMGPHSVGGSRLVSSRSLMSIGILVRLAPMPQTSTRVFAPPADSVAVTGGNGWLEIAGLEPEKLAEKDLGGTDFIGIGRGLKELLVEGARIEIRRDQQLIVLGDLRGGYGEDGTLRISGDARAAWLESRRLNPTKWERLPTEMQIFVLTSFVAMLAGVANLWRKLFTRLRDPAPLLCA